MAAPKIEYKDDTESDATTVRDAAPGAPGAAGRTTARIVLDELEAAGDRRQERPTFNRLLDSHAREALGEPFQGVIAEHGPTQTLPIVAVERAPLPQVTERDLEPPPHMTQPPVPSADASTLTTAASIEAVVPRAWPSATVKVAAGVVSAVTFVVLSVLLARAVVESPVAGQPSLSHATPATAALVASSAPTALTGPPPAASQPSAPTTAATTLAPPATARSARPVSSTPSSRPSSGAAKPASTFQGTIVEEY
ncbi:MAG: hypothetical protein HOO96_26975 [Polyangiaceae bacterium]|nr:hypothetical protein [Polyangiaceae bacterium]